jgi:hypothetical protein
MNCISKKILFLVVIVSYFTFSTLAQSTDSTKTSKKVEKSGFNTPFIYLGLNVGASSYVDINLITGVQLTERINIGLAGKYQYYSLGGSPNIGFSTHIYGGGVFLQTSIIKDFRSFIKKLKSHSGLYIHAEYELLSLSESYFSKDTTETNSDSRFWLQNILVGPGYINRFNKSSIFATLLWNINNTTTNPYEYPLFRVGFTYGF